MQELEIYAENTRSLMLYANLNLLRIDNSKANEIASHVGRCIGICDVLRKAPYYIGVRRNYIPLDVMTRHNCFSDKIYNRVGGETESVIVDEFYDVVLEVAAYARKHLMVAREIYAENREKLPKNTHRAMLLAQECDYFLQELEKYNFNIFESTFR